VLEDPPQVLAVLARGFVVIDAGQSGVLKVICAGATMQQRFIAGILLVCIV
jgi:hypothetical protein